MDGEIFIKTFIQFQIYNTTVSKIEETILSKIYANYNNVHIQQLKNIISVTIFESWTISVM